MNAALRENGVELTLHPLLRLEYSTWDSLHDVEAEFVWPPHLARAFEAASTPAREVAARWKAVCDAQDSWRLQLKNARAPRDLMQLFAQENPAWKDKLDEYVRARKVISELSREARVLQSQSEELRAQAKTSREAAAKTERAKGEDFRATVLPLLRRIGDLREAAFSRLNALDENGAPRKLSKEERKQRAELEAREDEEVLALRARVDELKTARSCFDEEILSHREAAKAAQEQTRVLIAQRVALEKSAQADSARATIIRLEYEAELERLRRVRDALTVAESLRYTNVRPTAWWLPLVSPEGKWFENIVRSARARIEEI
jgi:hypothetical protein